MIREDRPSSGGVVCPHRFSRLQGESGPKGEWVMVCERCAEVRYVNPPKVQQEGKQPKPLLME